MDAPLRTIHLYGYLADICLPKLRLAVWTPAEAVRAILVNFPNSMMPIREGEFHVIRGDAIEGGWDLDESFLHFGLGKDDLHIIPVASGAASQQSKGIIKIILGVALVAGAIALAPGGIAGLGSVAFEIGGIGITYGNIALFGVAMIFSGISYLLAPVPDKTSSDETDMPVSHVYRGPTNSVQQGNPVPVVYGMMRVGSQVISVGIENTMPTGSLSGGAGSTGSNSAPDRLSARLESTIGPIILSWQSAQGAQGYQYRYRVQAEPEFPNPWRDWVAVPGTDTEVSIAAGNFTRNIRYEFQVRAFFTLTGTTPSNFSSASSSVSLIYGFIGDDSNQNTEDVGGP